MNFFSFEFLGAFVSFFILYWLFQKQIKIQNILLITVSYAFLFYADYRPAIILLSYTLFIYLLANILTKYTSSKVIYWLLGLLVAVYFTAFKYYSFFQESLTQAFQQWGLSIELPLIELLAPLGLSFYIFHSVSYVVSVCRKEIPKAPFLDVVLYLCFFPSIVAGPINRAKEFLPQIQAPTRKIIDYKGAIMLIVLAIAKLFWLSGWFSTNYVDPVFNAPDLAQSGQVLTAIYAYAWHIYFNFSGYTNLVTGIALLLGFVVPRNFNAPYLAINLADFWRRWHISLSTFIRDYVYIPLGGNRKGVIRQNFNAFAAMVISGLWHGAAMTFIIWGAIHGIGVVLLNIKHRLFPVRKNAPPTALSSLNMLLSWIITFHFVCFAWIFFRSQTIGDALVLIQQLFSVGAWASLQAEGLTLFMFWGLFLLYPCFVTLRDIVARLEKRVPWYVYPLPLALILTIIFMLSPDGVPGFIYASF
ncbi:MBOAT family O-acyltransferase [Proteus sp. DFP240708]|uniref:MBOAT family O-acyltransferase n=1 Tax=Proteus TaxID=583 RepID=UPI0018E402E2|nr:MULTISPECIES: MBOAT family O-acyltransferase [Proteus]MBI6339936.1 MBOAT family protein [Proteus sp. PR00224]MBI6406830.1 MBOAT family protein [Proteus sp. PR00208]MBI6544360.1 MBOAT family protein [Proteus vulgaris]